MDLLTSGGWNWVVAAHLRRLPQEPEAKLFAPHDRAEVCGNASVPDLASKGRRLVSRRSKKRATRDANGHDTVMAKLQRRLLQGSTGSGKGGRFPEVYRDAVALDQAATNRDALFDRLHGVWTSLERDKQAAQAIYGYFGAL